MFSVTAYGQANTKHERYRDSLYHQISQTGTAHMACYFTYLQGSSVIHPDLNQNTHELSSLDNFIRYALVHPDYHISRIRLTGYSSIEGRYEDNELLARERVAAFYQYLRDNYPALYRYPHDMAWIAEDWAGLSEQIRKSDLEEKNEILNMIRRVHTFDDREALLIKLNGGQPYRKIAQTMLPGLRRVEIEIEYAKSGQQADNVPDPLIYNVLAENKSKNWYAKSERPVETKQGTSISIDRQLVIGDVRSKDIKSPHAGYRFAIKTNGLLWAGVLPDLTRTTSVANVALEYYIASRWSVEFGATYSYWRYNSRLEFQGISGYRLEPRYHIPIVCNRAAIYLGGYGRIGDYDLRRIDLTTQSTVNHTGKYWDAGLSAGITVNLIGGFGFEIGARAGYAKSAPNLYTQDNKYNWFDSRESYRKMRISDLNASLIYRFR